MRTTRPVLLVAALVAAAALGVAAFRDRPATIGERVDEVAESIRCPVCQNLSVADSTSRVAGEMRRSIAAQLRAGRSPDQIRSGFVAAYGEWILLTPRGAAPWIAPAAVVLAAAVIAAVALRRWTSRRGVR
jgi:cytochrome c-type biogenesis protein CcmH